MRPRYLHSLQSERVSPVLFKGYFSIRAYNWVILSQLPRKDRPRGSLPIPSEVHQTFQHNSTMVSPTEFSFNISAKYLSSHRVLSSSKIARVIFPPQSNLQVYSPTESSSPNRFILAITIPSGSKELSLQHQPRS